MQALMHAYASIFSTLAFMLRSFLMQNLCSSGFVFAEDNATVARRAAHFIKLFKSSLSSGTMEASNSSETICTVRKDPERQGCLELVKEGKREIIEIIKFYVTCNFSTISNAKFPTLIHRNFIIRLSWM